MTNHNAHTGKTEKPNYVARRVGVIAIAGLSTLGLIKAGQWVGSEAHAIGDRQAQVNEMGKFDHPLGTDRFSVDGIQTALRNEHVDPSHVTMHMVTAGEGTPTKVAEDMHAQDTWLVASEIADQSGGDHAMQGGEEVAIPTNQLAPQTTLVSQNKG